MSVPANSVNDNLLAGNQYEFLPYDASIEFGLVGDTNAADLRVDVYSGQDVLLENGTISAANRVPVYPDDFLLTDVAAAGERIKVRVRNTAAAARTVFFQVRITPIV
ncbi:MAG: hypothetical protein NZM12_04995 [Steroidobacteraceae bacterium]|nr:hypothetical protein [Steroidobacteraceae bacterium]MDW8260795.1 hypothetical protein [Gammaproteobacteria bacterium]